VIARSSCLLAPHPAYERVGDVPNVVLPTAVLVGVTVYYGAADTSACLAHRRLSDVVAAARS
jgi:beta-1,4-mannooligosaccharide/beta-1,4-mannosyl-N-acetylglucosamine phosphorylase